MKVPKFKTEGDEFYRVIPPAAASPQPKPPLDVDERRKSVRQKQQQEH
ncbi:MAG TPA: hypothetical protein VFJ87_01315 [Rhodanobacteraceae bacterium]|jgi:hypothetical protein|nr:hypothetical protein [Rhodanobacteraceae bacterium]